MIAKRLLILALLSLASCADPLVSQQRNPDAHHDTYAFLGGENPRIQGLVEAGVSDLTWSAGRVQVRIGFRAVDKHGAPIRLDTADATLEVRPTGTVLRPTNPKVVSTQAEWEWVEVSFTAPPLLAGQHFRLSVPFRDPKTGPVIGEENLAKQKQAVTTFHFEFGP